MNDLLLDPRVARAWDQRGVLGRWRKGNSAIVPPDANNRGVIVMSDTNRNLLIAAVVIVIVVVAFYMYTGGTWKL